MNHREWLLELRPVLAPSRTRRREAVSRLLRLAGRARGEVRRGLTEWHEQQALGLAAGHLEDAGEHRRAAALYRRVAKAHRAAAIYNVRALVDATTFAADALAKAGAPRAAARLRADAAALERCVVALGARSRSAP